MKFCAETRGSSMANQQMMLTRHRRKWKVQAQACSLFAHLCNV